MPVATAGIVEIDASVAVPKHIGVDHRITGVENRPVVQIGERSGRRIGHSDPDPESFGIPVGIFPPVGTVKEIITAVALIHLGSPEAVGAPTLLAAPVGDAGLAPGDEIVRDADPESGCALARTVHIETSVGGSQHERIAESDIQRIGVMPAATCGQKR